MIKLVERDRTSQQLSTQLKSLTFKSGIVDVSLAYFQKDLYSVEFEVLRKSNSQVSLVELPLKLTRKYLEQFIEENIAPAAQVSLSGLIPTNKKIFHYYRVLAPSQVGQIANMFSLLDANSLIWELHNPPFCATALPLKCPPLFILPVTQQNTIAENILVNKSALIKLNLEDAFLDCIKKLLQEINWLTKEKDIKEEKQPVPNVVAAIRIANSIGALDKAPNKARNIAPYQAHKNIARAQKTNRQLQPTIVSNSRNITESLPPKPNIHLVRDEPTTNQHTDLNDRIEAAYRECREKGWIL